MTFTPACDSAVAIPSPIPEAAPVTNAVCPAKSLMRFPPCFHSTSSPPDRAAECRNELASPHVPRPAPSLEIIASFKLAHLETGWITRDRVGFRKRWLDAEDDRS